MAPRDPPRWGEAPPAPGHRPPHLPGAQTQRRDPLHAPHGAAAAGTLLARAAALVAPRGPRARGGRGRREAALIGWRRPDTPTFPGSRKSGVREWLCASARLRDLTAGGPGRAASGGARILAGGLVFRGSRGRQGWAIPGSGGRGQVWASVSALGAPGTGVRP